MGQLKVKKKDSLILNVIVYLALSFLFLYLQYAYRHHLSPFSLVYLKKSLELFWYIALPIAFSAILIWRHNRHAVLAYSACIILVSFKVMEGLFIEFNKIIVVALFFYAVISYFLYQLLRSHYTLASLNPNYTSEDLFQPLLKQISCGIDLDGTIVPGYLTNWDEDGCFIKLNSYQKLPSKIHVIIELQGKSFREKGAVVAQSVDLSGVGIKFGKTPKDLKIFNWSEFTELVHELGFKPERLR